MTLLLNSEIGTSQPSILPRLIVQSKFLQDEHAVVGFPIGFLIIGLDDFFVHFKNFFAVIVVVDQPSFHILILEYFE